MRASGYPHSLTLLVLVIRVLFDHGLKEFEVGVIANLMPETAEEAQSLVPSLKVPRGGEPPLKHALGHACSHAAMQPCMHGPHI